MLFPWSLVCWMQKTWQSSVSATISSMKAQASMRTRGTLLVPSMNNPAAEEDMMMMMERMCGRRVWFFFFGLEASRGGGLLQQVEMRGMEQPQAFQTAPRHPQNGTDVIL